MKIVHGDQVEWKRGLQHRGGTFHYRHLLNGKPGTLDNFAINIGQLEGDFSSPRHRHNFDQFRIQIEGAMDFDRNGNMTAGMIGYFPEGAAYGPQISKGRSVNAVLQFGGASGGGYLSQGEVDEATVALKKIGTFKDGVFDVTTLSRAVVVSTAIRRFGNTPTAGEWNIPNRGTAIRSCSTLPIMNGCRSTACRESRRNPSARLRSGDARRCYCDSQTARSTERASEACIWSFRVREWSKTRITAPTPRFI